MKTRVHAALRRPHGTGLSRPLAPVILILSLLAGPALFAQSTAKSFADIDGKPNLNGIWQAVNEANWNLEAHSAEASPVVAMGAIGAAPAGLGVVEGGTIPYRPEAAKQRQENYAKRIELDPEAKCYLPGVPRATYMPYPFQIVQSPKSIFIGYEYANATRTIYMENPGEAPADSWMGQSVGHWEGRTLVVDVTSLNDQSWFDRSGNFHSEKLHVVERYTPVSRDVLNYEATIEDPQVFLRPWKISMPLYRRLDKNMQLLEFKCVEMVEELIYGKYRKKPNN
jgi:hypothetical protein